MLENDLITKDTAKYSSLKIDFKDIYLRDYVINDIEDDVRWMTTEIEWHDWDAPWEKEEDLNSFKEDEFREKRMKRLKVIPNKEILRTSLEICTQGGIHIGRCNSYLINNEYEWIPRSKENEEYRALGIGIRESNYWGKGLGTQALVSFIRYFLDNKTSEIYTQTWSGNYRMINLAQRIGFEECQRTKGSTIVRGNTYDGLTFKLDIDKYHEFYQRVLL